jgi:hypothetical protein
MKMPDMSFPRYVFAIGGAGKNLLYTTLEKDWLLREIIKPKFSPTTIDITVIDTAIDEENEDRERIQKIEKNIKRLEEEYRAGLGDSGRTIGRISIIYMLLTKDMILQSPYDLIGVGKEIKRATGASVWWINDPENLGEDWHKKVINRQNFKELNFTKGVYRKRAIGKAIYYKAVSEGKFDIDLLQTAQVDIFVGLGGGTGSGMAFDLAKKLKSIQPTADITLFGVLSTLDESPDEKANNFAAISEIEYGYLNKDTPFKDIIFIPMEITRYPGRERASLEHERLLREFDETIPYILMAYHNNPAQLFFSNLPEYAPFIVVTSQLIRYNVALIKKLKDKLMEAFNDKEVSLGEENNIYSSIKKFIDQYHADAVLAEGGVLPDDDKTFIKDDRFARFRMILDHQFFRELDYNSVKFLKRAVDAGIAGSSSEDIEKQISSIKAEVDTISIGEEGYKEDADLSLHKILKKDIENIDTLKNLLVIANRIQNNIIRDTLKIILKSDEYSLGRKLNQIREELDRLNGRRKQLEGTANSLEEEIKNYKEKIAKDIEKNNLEWKDNEIRNINVLDASDDLVPIINNDFSNLSEELSDYASRINSLTKNIETEPTKNIENIVDKISQELEKVGIYYADRSNITRSLIAAKEFKKAQIEAKRRIPIMDKLLGIAIKTDRIKKQKDAKNKVLLRTTELNSDKIFDVNGVAINVAYKYNVEELVNKRKEEIADGIISRLNELYSKASEPLLLSIKELLLIPSKRKSINIEDIIKSHLGYEDDVQIKDTQLKEKIGEIDQINSNINQYESLETMLKNGTASIKKHSNNLKEYYIKILTIEKDVVAMHNASKNIVKYIMEMQPSNIYRATLAGANINNILVDQTELSNLKQNLQGGLERTIDNRYNVLVRRVIETSDNLKRWDKTKVMNSFVTIANVEPEDIDSKRVVTNAFMVVKDNYSQWKCLSGDSWEIGLVLFIAGVPFDNIRNVTDTRAGYQRYYNAVEDAEMIFFHHSYLLENGKFVKRIKVFNLENEEDKNLFLQNNKDVYQLFLKNYEEKEIKNCLVSGQNKINENKINENKINENKINENKINENKINENKIN